MNRTVHIYNLLQPPVQLDLVASVPLEPTSPRPTLIFFHGGGLVSGSRRGRFPPLPVKLLLDRGWAVVVPDYRLLPEAGIVDILDDLHQLEAWMVQSAVGVDMNRVVVGGSSAGSLVSILALSVWKTVKPRAFLSLWGMAQTEGEWYRRRRAESAVLGGIPASQLHEENVAHYLQPGRPHISTDEADMKDPGSRASLFLWLLKQGRIGPLISDSVKAAIGTEAPLDLISSSYPSTVIVHGTADTVAPVTDSHALAAALQRVEVRVRLIEVDGADHGLAPQEKYRNYFEEAIMAVEEFTGN
ncbi:hypothetical protein N7520_010851 [Penicillium odoratum]|uniref:uncharacterized protein n=1 Tax=Penicillium odoratum TaxID=1167516 RepID=UPI0025482098|nr:uncharacterized protein N7520_010851 [Penicillium odoratum]KAJ5745669.1 hypothetical protein N7520_010851 [Penicillium odoratum]